MAIPVAYLVEFVQTILGKHQVIPIVTHLDGMGQAAQSALAQGTNRSRHVLAPDTSVLDVSPTGLARSHAHNMGNLIPKEAIVTGQRRSRKPLLVLHVRQSPFPKRQALEIIRCGEREGDCVGTIPHRILRTGLSA